MAVHCLQILSIRQALASLQMRLFRFYSAARFLCVCVCRAAMASEQEKHENQMMETYFPCMDKIKSAY